MSLPQLAAASFLVLASSAQATIVFTEGANTVSTPTFEWDFGNCASANVEQVDSVKWLGSGATELGPNLVANNGGKCPGQPTEFWGQSYGNEDGKGPGPVVQCSAGSWTPRGGRTLELNTVGPSPACTGDTPPIPVRTRYTFFDGGAHANMVRIERRWSFDSAQLTANPAQGMRTYVPRLSYGTYNQEIYPNASDTLVTAGIGESIVPGSSWSAAHQWVAINATSTNAGVLILHEPDSNAASLRIDYDGSSGSNNTGITLDRPPIVGWLAPVTETEYLCFYDATSWPTGSRAANVLPAGCSPATVPINAVAPTISAGAGDPQPGESFTASPGTWENSTGTFSYQWSRCIGDNCEAIVGAGGTSYTATAADVGRSLQVTVTATAPGGETDSASSNNAGTISGKVYAGSATPGNEEPNARVQACKVSVGTCRSTTANLQGEYLLQVPVSGEYEVSAFPGAGSNSLPRPHSGVTVVKDEADTGGQDVVLGITGPPPADVGFSGAGYRGNTGAGGVPVVHWQEPFVIEVKAPTGSEVEVEVEFPDQPPEPIPLCCPPAPAPSPGEDNFKFPVKPLYPNHGPAEVTVRIKPKPPTGPEETTFPIYIDPSGIVRMTTGTPLAGATVTLYRSESKAGPFEVVPDGSAVMSPMNRTNPGLSEADGHFGWDVIAGFYKVRAARSGCNAPGNPAIPFVETAVMAIPPPVTDLDIALECPVASQPGAVPILAAVQPPIAPPKAAPRKLKCKKGFVKKKVRGKSRCVKRPKKKRKKGH